MTSDWSSQLEECDLETDHAVLLLWEDVLKERGTDDFGSWLLNDKLVHSVFSV